MNSLTQQGIAALKQGDKIQARQCLREATVKDPGDIQAWLWLSGAVETDRERAECLQHVLRLDPDNQIATKGLAQLVARGAVSVQSEPQAPVQATQAAVLPSPFVDAQPVPKTSAPRATQKAVDKTIFIVKPSLIPVFVGGFFIALIFIGLWMLLMGLFPKGETGSLLRAIFTFFMAIYALGTGFQWLVALIRRLFARYTLTSRYLIVKKGVLSRSQKTIPVQRIQNVSLRQGVLSRLFGLGSVMVESAGERGAVRLISLPNCQEYVDKILAAAERT